VSACARAQQVMRLLTRRVDRNEYDMGAMTATIT
jgi:hypothetical protein